MNDNLTPARMRFFLDTEFIERGPKYPVQLISIGIVAEHGETLYLVSSDFREEDCSDWVKENVLPHLGTYPRGSLENIALSVHDWVEQVCRGSKPEFWGYYCDYDWVVFAQMFGTMMDLPKGWPMYCRDLKQLCDSLGNPKLPEQSSTEHNALADAIWNKQVYEFLQGTPATMEAEERPTLRKEILLEACRAQCLFCADKAETIWDGKMNPYGKGDINPDPVKLERQYVPNCGEMEGWAHHRSFGGFSECSAGNIRDLLAATPVAPEVTQDEFEEWYRANEMSGWTEGEYRVAEMAWKAGRASR